MPCDILWFQQIFVAFLVRFACNVAYRGNQAQCPLRGPWRDWGFPPGRVGTARRWTCATLGPSCCREGVFHVGLVAPLAEPDSRAAAPTAPEAAPAFLSPGDREAREPS